MPEEKEEIKEKSFLKKWLKIIIGGAIVPVLVFLITNIDKVEKTYKFASDLLKTSGQCHTLKVVTFPKVPYFLVHTIRQIHMIRQEPEIYWARLEGKNNCGHPLHVEITFGVINKDVANATAGPYPFTVDDKEEKNEELDPYFAFVGGDPNTDTGLSVSYIIKDMETNKPLKSATENIEVISKNKFCWNLKDPTNKEVSLPFLLAALSAWSLSPDEAIKKRARQFAKEASEGGDPSEFSRRWFKSCYSDLFHGPNRLNVHPYSKAWPPIHESREKSTQTIRDCAELLNLKRSDSIEAALLISALRNAVPRMRKSRLVFYAIPAPEEKDIGRKQFFLSWSTDGENWRALNMTSPNQMSFEENEAQATLRVKNLLQSESGILSALSSSGVFIDGKKTIFALDFDKASEEFGIRGLP